MDDLTPEEESYLQGVLCRCDHKFIDLLDELDERAVGLIIGAILVTRPALAPASPATATSAAVALPPSHQPTMEMLSDDSRASDLISIATTATEGIPASPAVQDAAPDLTATLSDDLYDAFGPVLAPPSRTLANASRVAAGSILLAKTRLDSRDFADPARFRLLASHSRHQSQRLNIVVKITRNRWTQGTGRTSYRIVTVDIGDGHETKLSVHNGTDLYFIDKHFNPLPAGTLAVLFNVKSGVSGGKACLTYTTESKVCKFRNAASPTWDDVLQWHREAGEADAPNRSQ